MLSARRSRSFLVHVSTVCTSVIYSLKKQIGVGPFGATLLLRIKLTHQNKLPVALEAPRDWHLQRFQDAGPLLPKQGPQFEPEALDDWTCVHGQPVWRLSGREYILGTHFTVKRGESDSQPMCHVIPKFPSFQCSLQCLIKRSLGRVLKTVVVPVFISFSCE